MSAQISCSGSGVKGATFDAQVARVSGGLAVLGIGPGDRVALILHNSVEFVEITMAVGRLGAFAVPINWHFALPEIEMLLDDCEPAAILVGASLSGLVPARWRERATIILVPQGAEADAEADGNLSFPAWRDASSPYTGPEATAPGSIVYTSGTTGRPKGVKRQAATPEQRRAMAEVRATLFQLSPESRVLVPGPLYHSFPNQLAVSAVQVAEHLEIMPRFDAEGLLRLIERERITTVGVAPIMFVRLLQLSEDVRRSYDLSSLQWAIHAGGPCAPEVKRAMLEWWGPIVAEYYGGTETGPLTLCTGPEWLSHPGSVGKPLAGARLRIVDAAGDDVPPGQPGEIYGRLDAYPDFTYHNDEEKRRDVGVGDLVSLGDIGFQDAEGYLYLCDRARDMIVSGGVNIYPAEVEGAIFALEGIDDCAVFGIPDAEFGESVVAYVVGSVTDTAALRQSLRAHVAGYKVPRDIVVVPSLDRDASGKLKKNRLREAYLSQVAQKREQPCST
ncbi:AMP-binding protein [Sphingomonas sp. 35-24ZXX]|uniref:AMP-binding protein n=1 Tax=Sphingomonas sp. 35-24ZXX TaxID=1545915 RepID=UPI00069167A1|nr:AMP-binding protein [Sphingomonas sp. 35-24ZXX]